MGPVVTAAARDRIVGYIGQGVEAGATPSSTAASSRSTGDGFWVGPTLFDNVTTDMSIYTDEIFGPVLAVVRVDTLDEAIELINATPTPTAPRSSPAPGRPRATSSARCRSG